ncbi:hypothetical protein V6257_17095 [Pseudoalteromonas issachenkonii]|uniref:Uncharacterized protein n=1 Tax=Pseudoalteromonas issachenkonii TaxID=152297 RepID=A0ABU9H4J3_9GAMM
MSNQEIATLIQIHFKFISTPSESEVILILEQVTNATTENEFNKIIFDNVSSTISFANESLEMSASISLLKQIKSSLGK